MNLINLSLHLDLMTLSDPLPPPLVSPPPRLTNPTVHPRSRCRPSDEPSPTLRADIFRLLFCRCGWHRWASVSPTWPSYNAALPAKSAPFIREQGNWNGFDRIVLHLLRPRTISPCFACHSATAENASSLASPRNVKPVKSTELSRSDGRGQNSI